MVLTLPEDFEGAETLEGEKVSVFKANGETEAKVTVPAYGSISLKPAKAQACCEPLVKACKTKEGIRLENDKVTLLIDDRGEITSYVLKENGFEYAKEPMNHLRLFKNTPRIFDAWDIDSNYEVQEIEGARDVETEIGKSEGFIAKVIVKGKIGVSEFTETISLTAGDRVVRVDMDIDWKELHRILKVAFPINVLATEGVNEIQFGYVKRPTHRSRIGDKDRFEVCNHRYSALFDGSHGAGVLNDCKYGIGMKDSTLNLTLLTAASSPEMRADNKRHFFSYGFMGWNGSFEESNIVEEGYRFNIAPVEAKGSSVKTCGFETSNRGIVCEAVKPADDRSKDTIVRLYEAYRSACTVKIRMPLFAEKKVWLCDLLEKREEEVKVNGNEVTLTFAPFEVKTLRVSD